MTISDARLDANRANAQFSTGPKTEEGKAKSSMNAVKTGLTGRSVLLTSDDAIIYQQHLDRNFSEFSPVTDREKTLVQTIADAEWRLLRITPLEAGIYAIGRLELANEFAAFADSDNREALIQGKIFITYRRDLTNLALQERRLRSRPWLRFFTRRIADLLRSKSISKTPHPNGFGLRSVARRLPRRPKGAKSRLTRNWFFLIRDYLCSSVATNP
jgi:hypothetical protein